MKHAKIILLLSLLAVSCQSIQTGKNIQENNSPKVTFIISNATFSSYDSLSVTIFDTTGAKMSNERGGWKDSKIPFAPSNPNWKIYLPFSDTVKLQVSDIKNEKVGDLTKFYLEQGLYSVSFWKLWNTKSGVYFLNAAFCDSLFKRKFIIIN